MSSLIKLKKKPTNLKLNQNCEIESIQSAENRMEEKISFEKELVEKYKNGFEDGYIKAEQKLKAKYKSELEDELIKKSEEFYKILSSFEQKIILYDEAFQKIISSVSIKIAEKIINSELYHKPFIESTLQVAAKKIIGANELLVRINPKDYEVLTLNGKLKIIDEHFKKINFETDERIEQGGCVIESEIGNVDSRVKSQLDELEKVFENYLNNL